MRPSDVLFHLIHPLTKSEKGYFKKLQKTHVIGEANN